MLTTTVLVLAALAAVGSLVSTEAVAKHLHPATSTPQMRIPFVLAQKSCGDTSGTTQTMHGPPLQYHACTPARPASDWLTVGTGDVNGQTARAVGYIRFTVVPGDLTTPENEADVQVEFSFTDVRNKSDLSDYEGYLRAEPSGFGWQMTDHYNGAALTETATSWYGWDGQGAPIFFALVPCEPTADTTVGSTCSSTVTFNEMLPNTIKEGKRTAIEMMGVFQVWDGGADGDPWNTTTGNTLFAREGIYIP